MKRAMRLVLRGYQLAVSPLLGTHCRFEPSCSCYAMQAFELHSPLRAAWLTIRRVLRCNPLSQPGHDPVPAANQHLK